MKVLCLVLCLLVVSACSTHKEFVKEKNCSPHALSYIKNSTGRSKRPPLSPLLKLKLEETQVGMQQCYEAYMKRAGQKDFQTCMVVGVDSLGRLEYYNFSANDIHSDRAFVQCAVKVTKKVPYTKFGKNYIMVQSYHFYH